MDKSMADETLAEEFASLVQSSMWVTTPEYAGWILKRTSGWLASAAIFRHNAWKKKWVSLHGTELLCLDSEPDIAHMMVEGAHIRRAQIAANTMVKEDDSDSSVEGFGFCIAFNDDKMPDWYLKADTKEEKANWMVKLSQVHAITVWMKAFEKVRVLGTGAQGTVYELRHLQSGKSFAMKEMEIKNDKQMKMAISEAQFLKTIVETVSHPNILYIEKVFQVGSKFYLVFPLCTGGELYDAVSARGHYSEHDTAVIIRDLISALHALHSNNILHLDIKPENILFDKRGPDGHIVLTDFGLSRLVIDDKSNTYDAAAFEEHLKSFVARGELETDGLRGTFGYMSPEVILLHCYSCAADVFAAGVVLYILLCGYPPFASKSLRQTLLRTVKGSYKSEGGEWDRISPAAKDLLHRMLATDPTARISTKDILKHPWIQSVQLSDPIQLPEQDIELPLLQALNLAPPKPAELPSTTSLQSVIPLSHENMTGALSRLADHVRTLKTHKMAATVSHFLSSTGQAAGTSRLAERFLIPAEGKDIADMPCSLDKAVMTLASTEVRSALAIAIFHLFGDSAGRLTVEQLAAARQKLGFLPPMSNANVGDLLLMHRMDRDGDGYIDAQDMLDSQLMVAQQTDNLIHAVFRVYAEAVWYPGKTLNYYHAVQQMQPNPKSPGPPSAAAAQQPVLMGDLSDAEKYRANMNEKMNVVVPPRYITEKNVAAIFERLGYDPVSGKHVFEILCETVRRMQPIEEEDEGEESGRNSAQDDEAGAKDAKEVRKAIIAPAPTHQNRKDRMDVNDFVRAARLDNILLQVLFRRTQRVMLGLCKRCEDRLKQMMEENPDIKEDVALASVVEHELRAQMQRVAAERGK